MTGGEQPTVALDTDELDRLESVLSRHSISFAMLFGSTAHGTMTDDSDLDLAVEFADRRPEDDGYSHAYLRLVSDLDTALRVNIDLVDVHTMSPRFAQVVFDTGTVIRGSDTRRMELERMVAGDAPSVAEARDRVAAAVARLTEDHAP